MIKYVEPTEEHFKELARLAPLEQVEEVRASHNTDIYTVAKEGSRRSEKTWAAIYNDELVGIIGVTPYSFLGETAAPWLLTTGRHPKVLLKETKKVLQVILDRWPVLINYIDARYESSLRWARWSGFHIHPAQPYGAGQLPFHRIELRKSWALIP